MQQCLQHESSGHPGCAQLLFEPSVKILLAFQAVKTTDSYPQPPLRTILIVSVPWKATPFLSSPLMLSDGVFSERALSVFWI